MTVAVNQEDADCLSLFLSLQLFLLRLPEEKNKKTTVTVCSFQTESAWFPLFLGLDLGSGCTVPSFPLRSGSTELLKSGKWMSDFFLVTVTPSLLPWLQRSDRKERSRIRLLSDTSKGESDFVFNNSVINVFKHSLAVLPVQVEVLSHDWTLVVGSAHKRRHDALAYLHTCDANTQ